MQTVSIKPLQFTRTAYLIEPGDVITPVSAGVYLLESLNGAVKQTVQFTANLPPTVGDYIIVQSPTDVYHCPKTVMADKYTFA